MVVQYLKTKTILSITKGRRWAVYTINEPNSEIDQFVGNYFGAEPFYLNWCKRIFVRDTKASPFEDEPLWLQFVDLIKRVATE